jgi:hypothetical protein
MKSGLHEDDDFVRVSFTGEHAEYPLAGEADVPEAVVDLDLDRAGVEFEFGQEFPRRRIGLDHDRTSAVPAIRIVPHTEASSRRAPIDL